MAKGPKKVEQDDAALAKANIEGALAALEGVRADLQSRAAERFLGHEETAALAYRDGAEAISRRMLGIQQQQKGGA